MVLVDKRILFGGIAMIVVGISLTLFLVSIAPIGEGGMTEEEKIDLLIRQTENRDYTTLAGLLIGVGFMLILISFGARRKRPAGAKKIEKKPEQ